MKFSHFSSHRKINDHFSLYIYSSRFKNFLGFTPPALIKKTHIHNLSFLVIPDKKLLSSFTTCHQDLPLPFIIHPPNPHIPKLEQISRGDGWDAWHYPTQHDKIKEKKTISIHLTLFGCALYSKVLNHPLPWESILLSPSCYLLDLSLKERQIPHPPSPISISFYHGN